MTKLVDRCATVFGNKASFSPDELRRAVDRLDTSLDDVREFMGPPGLFPYQRKLIFANEAVEVLVMNWANGRMCSPHNHGRSFGIIQVLTGEVSHDLYTLDNHDMPHRYLERKETVGTSYLAARDMVHAMGNFHESETVTIHYYTPPIENMRVYDIENCRACEVSTDCGAWWPAELRQLLREVPVGKPR